MQKAENTSNCMPPEGDWACRKRKTRQTACLLKGVGHAESGKHVKLHASWRELGMRIEENTSNCMPSEGSRACGKWKTRKKACLQKGAGHAESEKRIKKHAFRRGPGMRMLENTSKSMPSEGSRACR